MLTTETSVASVWLQVPLGTCEVTSDPLTKTNNEPDGCQEPAGVGDVPVPLVSVPL